MAQLAARKSHNLKVVSSILTRGTRFFSFFVLNGKDAQSIHTFNMLSIFGTIIICNSNYREHTSPLFLRDVSY